MGGAGKVMTPILGGLSTAAGVGLTALGNPIGIPLLVGGIGSLGGDVLGGPQGALRGGLAGVGLGTGGLLGGPAGAALGGLGALGVGSQLGGPPSGMAPMGATGRQPMSSVFGSWPMQAGGFPQPAMAGAQGGVVPQPPTTPQLAQPTIPLGPPLMQPATAPPTTAPAAAPQISPPGAITPTLQEFAQLLRGLAGPAAVGSI